VSPAPSNGGVLEDTNGHDGLVDETSGNAEAIVHHSTARSLLAVASSPSRDDSPPAPWFVHPEYERCEEHYSIQPYRWANYLPTDPVLEEARQRIRQPTDEELEGTAFVTMATGDAAARGATVLMQVRGEACGCK
jgi:hypothetical protein